MSKSMMGYQSVSEILIDAGFDPEEVHGLMTGWLCVNGPKENNFDWEKVLFPEMNSSAGLRELFDETAEALASEDFGFELLLPEDDQPLVARGKALVTWCQAFLAGLGISGFHLESLPTIAEATKDLAEIEKLDYESLDGETEEDARAFEEIFEYVRTAAMLICTEILVKKSESNTPPNDKNVH